ncbi:simple sugar transport system permease protein [Deinococcus metalli]|uniref:Xylose transport system permease protein XylH n=1 Tax=Deinococcus metalli TaxID=1141878 RepID=A0A7W8KES5_9DEIO|nr:ABC transporter permease [Deinococcus metalli]MBB5375691.1 simple sugar transport system permease protein [Deinococcus metalli]GHF37743.1 sugar ABC transporter [Deinococcus metalli]
MTARTAAPDERLAPRSPWQRLLSRPEFGALAGLLLVFVIFTLAAGRSGFLSLSGTVNYLEVAAQVGIVAVFVGLLMIGGEFDLSVGSMLGAAGIVLALLIHPDHGHLPLIVAIPITFAVAAAIGWLNGWLVLRTGLPSFIVTLAMLFVLRGASLGFTKLITKLTLVQGIDDQVNTPLGHAFSGNLLGVPASVWWWLLLTAVMAVVLNTTRFGNWVFAVGGDANAARNVGVPVRRVKTILFMLTAMAATLVAIIQVTKYGSADVLRGTQLELNTVAAAVIGGCLLTGGYGSVIGASIGALILGMVQQGIIYTSVDSDWFQVMVGAMILGAVILNNALRSRAMLLRRKK